MLDRGSFKHICCFVFIFILLLVNNESAAQNIQEHTETDNNTKTIILVSQATQDIDDEFAWPEAEEALQQELLLLNFAVEILTLTDDNNLENNVPTDTHNKMRLIAEQRKASAVRLIKLKEGTEAEVELWITNTVTGQVNFVQLSMKDLSISGAALDVAVRTSEALRAAFIEMQIDESAIESRVSPSSTETVPSSPLPSKPIQKTPWDIFAIAAGISMDYSSKEVGARGAFDISGLIQPVRGFDIELNIAWSPIGKDLLTLPDMSYSAFKYALVGIWFFYRLFHNSLFQPAIGFGAGSLIGWVEGRTQQGITLLNDIEALPFVGGSLRGFLFIKRNVALIIGAAVGATFPRIQLKHGEYLAGYFGHPLVKISLSLQFRLKQKKLL